MANNCHFDVKVLYSNPEDGELLKELFRTKWTYPGASYEEYPAVADVDFGIEGLPKYTKTLGVYGDCRWSVSDSFLDALLEESAKRHLVAEVWSSEPGIGFQEHYLIADGSLLENEYAEFVEHWVFISASENMERFDEATNEEVLAWYNKKHNVDIPVSSIPYLKDYSFISIGGFENFGEWSIE